MHNQDAEHVDGYHSQEDVDADNHKFNEDDNPRVMEIAFQDPEDGRHIQQANVLQLNADVLEADDDLEGHRAILRPNGTNAGIEDTEAKALNYYEELYTLAMPPEPCRICLEAWPDMIDMVAGVCRRCHHMPKRKAGYFSTANNTNPMLEVPACLRELSMVEESLISLVSPLISIIHLRHHGVGYRGHTITFPKDIIDIARELPRRVEDIIIFKRPDQAGHFREFKVRRQRVVNALDYLKQNHPDYTDCLIRADYIEELPIDGFLEGLTHDVDDMPADVQDNEETDATDLASSTVPIQPVIPDAARNIERHIGQADWPMTDNANPVDEYAMKGLLRKAFPQLFPNGEGDITMGNPIHKVRNTFIDMYYARKRVLTML